MRRATPGAAATSSAPIASQPSTIHGKRSYGAEVPATFL